MKLSEFLVALNDRIAAAKVSGFWTDIMKELWIYEAVVRVCTWKNWKDLEDSQTDSTIKDREYYTYPTTFKTDSVFLIEIDDDEYIKVSWDEYRENKEASGSDKVFSIFAGKIYINPTPTAVGVENIVMWGYKNPVEMPTSEIFTVTIASPAVFTKVAYGLSIGDSLKFTTTGLLPTGLVMGTTYYIITAGFTVNTFRVSTTLGGTAVNTSGSQSGVHKYLTDGECTLSDKFNEAIIKLSLATCLGKGERKSEAVAEIAEVETPASPRIKGSGGILAKLAASEESEGAKGYIGKAKSSRFM